MSTSPTRQGGTEEKVARSEVRRKDKQFELAGEADTTNARWPAFSRDIYLLSFYSFRLCFIELDAIPIEIRKEAQAGMGSGDSLESPTRQLVVRQP